MQLYTWLDRTFFADDSAKTESVKSSGKALIGGAFTLTNQNGEKVSDTDFKGKLMLVYFGFTNCPMICPTDLAVITGVLDELSEGELEKIQPIFITIDPERDTVAQIKTHLENFHPKIQGLTGSAEEIAAAANAYRVFYQKVEAEDLAQYQMNHSAFMYLMDKNGEYITHFRHKQPVEEIVASVRKHF